MAFDLDLAVERLLPGAMFLPNTGRTAIQEWRDPRTQPTPAELQAASDVALAEIAATAAAASAERTQLRQVYIALRDGTGTQGVRVQRLEQVVAWLMRNEALSS